MLSHCVIASTWVESQEGAKPRWTSSQIIWGLPMDTSVHHLQPLEFFSCCSVGQCSWGVPGCACRMSLIPILCTFCSLLLGTVQPCMHHSPYRVYRKVNSTLRAGEYPRPPFTDFIQSSCEFGLPDTGLIFSSLCFLDFQPCLRADWKSHSPSSMPEAAC